MSHGNVKLSADKLRAERLGRGLSLDRLAGLTAGLVSARQLLEYEQGRRSCDPERFALLCQVLGVEGPALSAIEASHVSLEDLRHWAGLTAQQAAGQLGMSSWSLLRAEKTGRLPAGTTDAVFVTGLARLYGCPAVQVSEALHRSRINDHGFELRLYRT